MTMPLDTAIGRHSDAADPLAPLPYRVVARRAETADVATLLLAPLERSIAPARPGQFNMLTAYGVGEVAISVSGLAAELAPLCHTVRDVGPVSHALFMRAPGDVVGVRGPFGTDWGVDTLAERDAVIVAGGIGLAPLAGAAALLAERARAGGGRLFVAVGARSPSQLLFPAELDAWAHAGAQVRVSVDAAPAGWSGSVGLVTQLLPELDFDPQSTVALVCGPEVMIRFSARALLERGVPARAIRISLERNMQCGVALCGHCQLGPLLLCRDGPVVTYDGIIPGLLAEDER